MTIHLVVINSTNDTMDVDLFNRKLLETDLEDERQRWIQISILFILGILAFVLNIYVIVTLARKRYHSVRFSNIDLLILHLGIADILVAGFCVLADAGWKITYQWLAGDFMCRAVKYMQMFSLYASTNIIVVISLDRCFAIVNPMPRIDQHLLVKRMTMAAWIVAGLCSIPQVFVFGVMKAPFETDTGEFYQCVTHGAYTAKWQETTYVVFTFCVIFALPLLIIIISYVLIFGILHKESHKRSTDIDGPYSEGHQKVIIARTQSDTSGVSRLREHTMKKAKTKTLWISVLVISAFVICWAPYHLAMILFLSMEKHIDNVDDYKMFQHIFFFGMSNSVANPFIYGVFHMIARSKKAYKQRSRRERKNLMLPKTTKSFASVL
ncbi:gonadotropin-releasing hormone receptor-like [Paramacrobiotus metropolitanus]|uniref:gonadotropin-releasing hormone receptor-like n=1 Tax=Paramacrobiotus metropolitanus TaxID=2943436 RepID=UPI002445865B|nr:gonadotropin-releasing hormone receptor-like [Paramacrobiotus metropolitanus]XP_055344421.1 gonadotropin-releasing hormone receptor-like [Paramacrobiotus metropolitanus]